MPIYEYVCRKCDKVFEELIVRTSDEAELHCPVCHGEKVSRVLSRTAAGARSGSRSPSGACGPVG